MKVAILGNGTIGKGVYEMLLAADGIDAGPVFVRPGKEDKPYKTSDINSITGDDSVDAVVEAMGGIEPAFSYVKAAMLAGKHAVTSNKALVAAKGIELNELARRTGVGFLFSAACGGGMPFLHNLELAVKTDIIISMGGILNGTTNYMLDAMQRRGLSYGEALDDARQLGYAEADPSADLSGLDALRKIMLGCAVGFDVMPAAGLCYEGIENIISEDVADFKSRGLACRLLAQAGQTGDEGVYAFVEPVLLPFSAPECSVLKNYNMARYMGLNSGPMVFMGQGAGSYPTASAVLRDLSCIQMGQYYMLSEHCRQQDVDNSDYARSYYVRLPEELALSLPVKDCVSKKGVARVITESVSVKWMHDTVKGLRDRGAEVFFAGLESDHP